MSTYEDRHPNEPHHFNDWWAEQIRNGTDPKFESFARSAWNKALDLAADEAGVQEGTSFGVELIFRA